MSETLSAETRPEPFPHMVIDGYFGRALCELAAAEFPPPDDTGWHTFTPELERGKQEGRAQIAGPAVAAIHARFASPEFVGLCADLFGIAGLQADPAQVGGGIHQSCEGARLGVHVDFNLSADETMERAVNAILYLTWSPPDPQRGGHLELWDGRRCVKRVRPMPDRLVLFVASDRSWHGHPVPIAAGVGCRKSVPAYLFRPRREGVVARSTVFL